MNYEKQIEAILNNDWDFFENIEEEDGGSSLAFAAWNYTIPLFAEIGKCGCLTQAKALVTGEGSVKIGYPYLKEAEELDKNLNFSNNDLIPNDVPDDWNPTREVLEEFAKLQKEAHEKI